MRTESNNKPEVLAVEECAQGLAEIVLRENITETQKEEETVYLYDEYRLTVPARENLASAVKQNLAAWLAQAKDSEKSRLAAAIREKRDKLLKDSDARMCLDRMGLSTPSGTGFTAWLDFLKTLAKEVSGEWAKYRKALRDLPEQPGFPYDVTFPTPPEDE